MRKSTRIHADHGVKCKICDKTVKEANMVSVTPDIFGWQKDFVNICDECVDRKDAMLFVEKEKYARITKMIEQEYNLKNAEIQVEIQDCDDMSCRKIEKELSKIKDVTFRIVREYEGIKPVGVIINVDSKEDFLNKFGKLNVARTDCGCSLFIGDGCQPGAFNHTAGEHIDFDLLRSKRDDK